MAVTLFQRSTTLHPCSIGTSSNPKTERDADETAGTTAFGATIDQPAQTSDDPRIGWTSEELGADGSDWNGTWQATVEITAIGSSMSATSVWARRQSNCTFVSETQTGDTVTGTGVHNVSATNNLGAGAATDRAQFKLHLSNTHMMNTESITVRYNLSTHDITFPITVTTGPPEVTATVPLGLGVGGSTQTDHSAASSVPLGIDVGADARTDHSAAADVPLGLTVDPVTQQPANEVTATIPLGLDVGADTATDHSAVADVPLGLDVGASTQAPGGTRASITLGLDVGAETRTDHSTAADVQLGLDVGADTTADHAAAAGIPLTLDVASFTAAERNAAAQIPLVIETGALSAVEHRVAGQVGLALDVAAAVLDPANIARTFAEVVGRHLPVAAAAGRSGAAEVDGQQLPVAVAVGRFDDDAEVAGRHLPVVEVEGAL